MVWNARHRSKRDPPEPVFAAAHRALGVAEVLLEIVGHLDQLSLTRTALVNKHWLNQSQQVLHHSPDVSRGPPPFAAHAAWLLLRTVSARPELGKIVRGLTIRANDELEEEREDYHELAGYSESKELIVLRGLPLACARVHKITFVGKQSLPGLAEPTSPVAE